MPPNEAIRARLSPSSSFPSRSASKRRKRLVRLKVPLPSSSVLSPAFNGGQTIVPNRRASKAGRMQADRRWPLGRVPLTPAGGRGSAERKGNTMQVDLASILIIFLCRGRLVGWRSRRANQRCIGRRATHTSNVRAFPCRTGQSTHAPLGQSRLHCCSSAVRLVTVGRVGCRGSRGVRTGPMRVAASSGAAATGNGQHET